MLLIGQVNTLEVMVGELAWIIALRVVALTARTNELVFEPFHVRSNLINGMAS